jgi:4-hydroxybenzoate polyprenyltransferase/phosphoserine phosphatase
VLLPSIEDRPSGVARKHRQRVKVPRLQRGEGPLREGRDSGVWRSRMTDFQPHLGHRSLRNFPDFSGIFAGLSTFADGEILLDELTDMQHQVVSDAQEQVANKRREQVANDVPLVVDLDGTLIKTDLLVESFFALLSTQPMRALRALIMLRHGRATFKARLAEETGVDFDTLPLNEDVHARLREEKSRGRRIYFASASDRRYVEQLSARVGLFDGIFASDGRSNLKGPAKAAALCAAFGEGRFDYIGDAYADLPVWKVARKRTVANPTPSLLRAVHQRFPDADTLGRRESRILDYVQLFRVHQWLKNLLIFVPPLAAHDFQPATLLASLLAFLSFSLAASSAYVLNDLLDVRNDRSHPSKRHRPFASGKIPVSQGVLLFPLALACAMALAVPLPISFALALGGYYTLTIAYSLWLKRKMTIDVVMLACLYGVRLVAGGAATAVPLSPWLQAFAIFLFLSLAIIKRCTELATHIAHGKGDPKGRCYQLRDLPLLESMAAASGYVAVMIFALYLNSPAVVALYRAPHRLWFICVVLLYWLSRILLLTHRGQMRDDPVIFAATDRVSLVCAVIVGAVVALSI